MAATESQSKRSARVRLYRWLAAVGIFVVFVQFIYFFWHLHHYRDPFRDEAYFHLLLGICAVAGVSAWRRLDSHCSADDPPRFGIVLLLRAMTLLAAAYIAVIVCFLTIATAYATQPLGTSVEGFSRTASRLFSFGAVYFLLAVLLLVFAFPIAIAIVIPLRELSIRKRINRMALSLIWSIVLPVVLYLVLIPFLYDFLTTIYIGSHGALRREWILALPYFSPVTWLETPSLSIWLLPFGILLIGWSSLNMHIIRKYLRNWSGLGREST